MMLALKLLTVLVTIESAVCSANFQPQLCLKDTDERNFFRDVNIQYDTIHVQTINLSNTTQIKTGDVMQCQVLKTYTKGRSKENSFKVFTEGYGEDYRYYQVPLGNCFSFEVRSARIHIALGSGPRSTNETLEIIFGERIQNSSKLRTGIRRVPYSKFLTSIDSNMVSEEKFTSFWIRWSYNQFLEIGLESEEISFLAYRNPTEFAINYIGIQSWQTEAAWTIDNEPSCPGNHRSAELHCNVIRPSVQLSSTTVLLALQKNLLNQIEKAFEIFRNSENRNKKFVELFLIELEKIFNQAKQIQEQIVFVRTANLEIEDESIFNKITLLYFEYSGSLQNELFPLEIN